MMQFVLTFILLLTLFFVVVVAISAIVALITRVPYVPTSMKVVRHMVRMATIKPKDHVYDLGCGDGRFLYHCEKMGKGSSYTGFELAPFPYLCSVVQKLFRPFSKVSIRLEDFFGLSLSEADVIFCYLTPSVVSRLYNKLRKEAKPGTRLYSHAFAVTGVEPQVIHPKDTKQGLPVLYEYVI